MLAIGLSRNFEADKMNKLANYGSEVGNFIFVDTYKQDW